MIELGLTLAKQGRIREAESTLLEAEALQSDYFDLVHGRNEKYLDLLTYIK